VGCVRRAQPITYPAHDLFLTIAAYIGFCAGRCQGVGARLVGRRYQRHAHHHVCWLLGTLTMKLPCPDYSSNHVCTQFFITPQQGPGF